MSITETISELDGLREKATQGEWQQYPDGVSLHMEDRCGIVSRKDWKWAERPKYYVAMSLGDRGAMDLNDAAYIIALHNAYPALRRAVMAGEALAESLQKDSDSGDCGRAHVPQLLAYRSAIEEKNV